ncbi:MAG: NAD(P)H-dependent glycerol-3-phosphate dehydrogenase [Mycobacterium leprae]
MSLQIAIIPAGAWGTAIALPAAEGGNDVRLWRRHPGWSREWQGGHPALPGLVLPANARAFEEVEEAVRGADLVVLGSASVAVREYCRLIRPHLRPDAVLVSITKGIEVATGLRMTEVVAQELPEHAGRIVALSGPNFAHEVANGLPTGTVVACPDQRVAEFAQDALMSARFRVYTNTDLLGVELAGALKNIIAIGAGLADGLGMGDNARATVITRGLTEIARLGVKLGANVLTFAGLAGMGDLVLTCTGNSSRNRQTGMAIGRGQAAAEFVQQRQLTVEGIPTTRAVHELAQRLGVEMPITEQIYRVLYEDLPPLQCVENLMGREPRHETEEVLRQPFVIVPQQVE